MLFIFSDALKLLNLIRNTGLARSRAEWTELDWTGQECSALRRTEIEWTEVILARNKWTGVYISNLD
jgi:hypothetical protein